MTGSPRDVLTRASGAALDYLELLRRTEQTTDELLAALQSWSVEEAQRLLSARSNLCEKIGDCARSLENLILEAGAQDRGAGSHAREELQALIGQIQVSQSSLAGKQAECESTLSAGLSRCKTALVSLNQRRGLQDAYGESPSGHEARFLDSKL